MPQPGPGRRANSSRSRSARASSSAPTATCITNAHVVEAADEITVQAHRQARAQGEGDRRGPPHGHRAAQDRGDGLPFVRFGDPERLRVGEWVVAIGSPFGFENTVTAGIVSAKGRSLPQENFVPFIQTDVAVNPGNSGGPLFNLRGEVVGINSAIYSRTGGFMGLSFAIPIDVANEIAQQLKTAGRVIRGRIGVVIQPVTKELADSFGLPKPQGALVNSVEKGGPAEKAGIEPGDVILRFDGKPVASSEDLPRIVGGDQAGQPRRPCRSGATSRRATCRSSWRSCRTTAAARSRSRRGAKPPAATPGVFGMTLSELTEAQQQRAQGRGRRAGRERAGRGGARRHPPRRRDHSRSTTRT